MIFFTTLCLAKNYEINVNFESGFEYKSQEEFIIEMESIKKSKGIIKTIKIFTAKKTLNHEFFVSLKPKLK